MRILLKQLSTSNTNIDDATLDKDFRTIFLIHIDKVVTADTSSNEVEIALPPIPVLMKQVATSGTIIDEVGIYTTSGISIDEVSFFLAPVFMQYVSTCSTAIMYTVRILIR